MRSTSRVSGESAGYRAREYRTASTPARSTTSSSVTISPARLERRTSSPPLRIFTSCPMRTSRVVSGAGCDRLESRDVPMMVRAEKVEAGVKTTPPLVEVIRGVRGEIGLLTVAAHEHTVAVVAEIRGAQPYRAVSFVDMPLTAEFVERRLHRPGFVQHPFGEPYVEMHPEMFQGPPLPLQLPAIPLVTERGCPLVRGQVEEFGMLTGDFFGQVVNVPAVVAVVRDRLTDGRGGERRAEFFHLGAAVVDVKLPRHLCACGLEDPGERIADSRPPGVPQMQRPGRVGGDEFHVDALTAQGGARSVPWSCFDDLPGDVTLRTGGQPDIEKTGPGNVDRGNTWLRGKLLGQDRGDVTRRASGGLGELQGDVGSVIPEFLALGPFDEHLGGD